MRSLESQKIPRLDSLGKIKVKNEPSSNGTKSTVGPRRFLNPNQHKKELKKLNHSILISYLELLDVLVKAPCSEVEGQQHQTLREQKLDDLSVLFKNMHHLINELRSHQARDTLICFMESQKQERIELAEKFRRHLERCVNVLETCIDSIDSKNSIKRATISNDELTKMLATVDSLGRMLNETNQKSKSNNNIDSRKEANINHRHNNQNHYKNNEINIKNNHNSHQNSKLNGFRNYHHNNNNINNYNHHDELNEHCEEDITDIANGKTKNKHHLDDQKQQQQDDDKLAMNTFEFRNEVLCDFIDDYLI